MMTYSVAIRTLGTSGELLQNELLSIFRQTVQPERVLIYIARGYSRPSFTVSSEQYITVPKGMMAQRLLPYREVSSDCLLLLDDDVSLKPDSVERLLAAMEEHHADCVAADTFQNHLMSTREKWQAALTNWVLPHTRQQWAFQIHRHGSFSYQNRVQKPFYWSQSAAGPAALWKANVFRALHLEDELWLDQLGFPFGEDALQFYKLHRNGYQLGVLFNSGVTHENGQSSSGAFRYTDRWMYVRTQASFLIWWRTCFRPGDTSRLEQIWTATCYGCKAAWLLVAAVVTAIVWRRGTLAIQYMRGLYDGWNYVHSAKYIELHNFVFK
jgi:GT2 family glycosyltransferase